MSTSVWQLHPCCSACICGKTKMRKAQLPGKVLAPLPLKRWKGSVSEQRPRHAKQRFPVCALLVVSMIAPLVFLAGRLSIFISSNLVQKVFLDESFATKLGDSRNRKLSAVDQIETFFPKEVLDVIIANSREPEPLDRNIIRGKALSSSLVEETKVDAIRRPSDISKVKEDKINQGQGVSENDIKAVSEEKLKIISDEESENHIAGVEHIVSASIPDMEVTDEGTAGGALLSKNANHAQLARRMRLHRHEKRLKELLQQDEEEKVKMENEAIEHTKEVHSAIIGKYSIWRHDESENSESLVRLMRDQLIMARAYASIAQARQNDQLLRDVRFRLRDSQRCVGEASFDADLCRSAPERIRAMGQILTRAREEHSDGSLLVKKLRAMLQSAEEHARMLKKQSTFLSQLAAKTIPKGLHCLSLRLNVEYHMLPSHQQEFANQEKLEDRSLYHYALFSDNILAVSVVVSSVILHAQEPEKHVFHLVTDKLNYGAMKMWFLSNPLGKATIHVENVDNFTWLNSSYCPVLRQLEHKAMKDYYFKQDQPTSLASVSSNLKYRNPKYLSMLNHLRFYLPQIYPKLNKILFLDDDIVVQKDLTRLWSVDLHGKVNGAVETCGASFHRFDKYLNFSNPHIARNFDPNACGWAYGMNVFDLDEWKRQDITGIYHKWQNLNEERNLWKLGTLPPGLITFYNLTYPLDKSWHVLGLGYNPSVDRIDIDGAAVIHYNGNLKPWLEIGLARYKPFWAKYVKFDHPFIQQCNINE
ncbi:hypothetical protein O6H91_Y139300 [Diphasiastrum complanatum]|nr:hypothetical protein O6H91_Y139300 [Diphasiastrum complanatum]